MTIEKKYKIYDELDRSIEGVDGDVLFDEADSKGEYVADVGYKDRWAWEFNIKNHKVLFLAGKEEHEDLWTEAVIIGEDETKIREVKSFIELGGLIGKLEEIMEKGIENDRI